MTIDSTKQTTKGGKLQESVALVTQNQDLLDKLVAIGAMQVSGSSDEPIADPVPPFMVCLPFGRANHPFERYLGNGEKEKVEFNAIKERDGKEYHVFESVTFSEIRVVQRPEQVKVNIYFTADWLEDDQRLMFAIPLDCFPSTGIISGLLALAQVGALNTPVFIQSERGTQRNKPLFTAITVTADEVSYRNRGLQSLWLKQEFAKSGTRQEALLKAVNRIQCVAAGVEFAVVIDENASIESFSSEPVEEF